MDAQTAARKYRLGLLARAPDGRVSALLAETGLSPTVTFLRKPEIGSVMVRGRIGGTGAAFNLGEMTVTRCALKLECGSVGHGHVQGRRKVDAEAAATVDALMQTDAADAVKSGVLDTLRREEALRRQSRAQKAAATKVDFFTMARGED